MHETIGQISGLLVIISVIPYAIRTYQSAIRPNVVSWSIWTVLGLALLITYWDSGAGANVWPALFGFSNPLLITLLAFWKGERKKPTRAEILCIIVGLLSIALWMTVRTDKSLVQHALYIAIAADIFAAIPTFLFVLNEPWGDRPFAWGLFSFGYGLAIFAITDHSLANYALPVYMTSASFVVCIPLVLYRIRTHRPAREWI